MTHTHSQPGAFSSQYPATSRAFDGIASGAGFYSATRPNRPPVRHGQDAAPLRASVSEGRDNSPPEVDPTASPAKQLPGVSASGAFSPNSTHGVAGGCSPRDL